jgi:hypothetical protein
MSIETLPDLPRARLPATYEAARNALAECSRIDECAAWANKAEALASYARQAKDEQLRKLADRIQARAMRRCGELLKQIDGRGDHMKKDGTVLSRVEAAEDAGLSERQRKTALRVASVAAQDFERQVESDEPPTVTELARQGTQSRAPAAVTPDLAELRRFVRFCGTTNPAALAAMVPVQQRGELAALVGEADAWLDQFVASL